MTKQLTYRLCFLLIAYLLWGGEAYAQSDILETQIELKGGYFGPTDTLINRVSHATGITISYSSKVYANQGISIRESRMPLFKILDRIFTRFPVEYVVKEQKIIVAPQKVRYFTLSGYCKDALNGEVLIGANVYDTLLYIGQGTNDYGFFSITLPEGHMGIRASFIGYKTVTKEIYLQKDTMINMILAPTIMMKDIDVVVDESTLNKAKTSTVELPMEQVKAMPSLLGEADVIKALEWTPGVHGGEEGFGGMSVRGGNSDQNIVMLDDVPLYSPNHLGGLYSVFNSESVNSATLTKGGFPARYGGRLSSVLDVKMKEGNMKKFSGFVNIGTLASNATLEGPIIKDKMSFVVSARRTYFDIFSAQIQRNNDQKYAFNFYDIHAKLNYIINDKDRLYVSFFTGYDNLTYGYNYRDVEIKYANKDSRKISLSDSQKIKWGNIVTSARWNHVFGSTLFANATISYSRYRFSNMLTNYANNDEIAFENGYYSGIKDYCARLDFNWYTPFIPGAIRFGANLTYHGFYPGVSVYGTANIQNNDSTINVSHEKEQSIYRHESHFYVEDELTWKRVTLNIGLHSSALMRADKSMHMRIEPRALIGIEAAKRLKIRLGFSDMTQFIQQMRMVSVASPADIWIPVSDTKPIPRAWQVSCEATSNLWYNIVASGEIYYKKYVNQQTYKTSLIMDSFFNNNWENAYTSGNGFSKGFELFLHKTSGRISGWMGYAYSKARSKYAEINDGEEMPSDNDRTHSFSTYASFKINDMVDISATWQYTTGSPTTIADSRYIMMGDKQNYSYPIEGVRNGYRMPDSHTLNIGANIKRQKKKTERKLSFGIYNVYAQQNPMFVYWKQNDTEAEHKSYKLKQFSLIAWPWPYLKYSIKF